MHPAEKNVREAGQKFIDACDAAQAAGFKVTLERAAGEGAYFYNVTGGPEPVEPKASADTSMKALP